MAGPKMSRNKRLTIAWSIFSFLFMASAIVMIVTSTVWRTQDANSLTVPDKHTLRAMTISKLDLDGAQPGYQVLRNPAHEPNFHSRNRGLGRDPPLVLHRLRRVLPGPWARSREPHDGPHCIQLEPTRNQ